MIILHFLYQLGKKSHTMGAKNNTKEDCNQDGIGIRRCSVYVLDNPTRQCYTQFFVGGQPPVGLRPGNLHLPNIRYICQPPQLNDVFAEQLTDYATMFDEAKGIAVFSAYKLTQDTSDFNNYPNRYNQEWYPTPGNLLHEQKKNKIPV